MENNSFPFPGIELAQETLRCDPCINRIPRKKHAELVQMAWHKGNHTAMDTWHETSGQCDFVKIFQDHGISIAAIDKDQVIGGTRYFSEYLSGKNEVILYKKSISAWADHNYLDYECAKNMMLSHEYFHYLECNKIGLTSRDYLVPMLKIGPLSIGKTGIRALSEIGAYAFSIKYMELIQEG